VISKLKAYMSGDSPFHIKIFYIVAASALFASLTGALTAISGRLPYTGSLLAALAVCALMLFVYKTGKSELGSYILIIFIDCLLFPYCFYLEGGIHGGVSMWYILSFFAVFLLVRGKWFWPLLILSFVSMAATYILSYYHPEWVTPLKGQWTMYMDFMFSILIIGTISGIIVRFQNQVYLAEQQKMQRQNRELERLSNTRNSFFANMSHEIRTPINTIIGLNEMILREDVSDEVAENAMHIQSASKMLLALINDILDMSKMESGKMEIVPVQYDTGALFSDLVNIIWIRAHEKNLELRLDISPELPSALHGDAVRIKQVVTNLLSNAVKYTPKGSVTLSAHSEAIRSDRILLTISVSDSGIGIRKEDMQQLFHSFKRVDGVSNAGIEGTGLGLAISQQLVELMGGRITVDSIYQKGSVFTIQLEQQIINSSPIGRRNFMVKTPAGERSKYRQSFEAPDVRVLVVDDNEMNRIVAKKLLRETRIQVDLARSGQECLELTRQHFYHVIFMDHMMPGMDGVETLRRLLTQENGLCHDTPVVALTANVTSDADRVYRDKGFYGYLAKPVSGAQLEATLLRFLPRELVEYNLAEAGAETENGIHLITRVARRKVHITTDSACDLPAEFMEQHEVGIMPYYVCTDQGRFRDTNELTSDNLLEYLLNGGGAVKSESATVEEYERFFADALDIGEHVIHISMTRKMGTGYDTACAAAESYGNVTVVDSGQLSSGMGFVVMRAVQMAEMGASTGEILQRLEELKGCISNSFIAPSVKPLRKKGNLSYLAFRICELFELHPVLSMKGGEMALSWVYRGNMDRAYAEYIRKALQGKKDIDSSLLFITYAGCSTRQLKDFIEKARKYQQFEQIILQKTSATISSNCGLGAMGVAYVKKEAEASA